MRKNLAIRLLSSVAILCGTALMPAPASASTVFDQSNTPLGTASASACSGIGASASASPGTAWNPGNNGVTVCNYGTGVTPGVSSAATASQAPNPFPYVDSSTASAVVQKIKLFATHTGDSGYFLPQAYAQGGWNDSLTLNVSGIWVFPIDVNGTFISSGPGGFGAGYLEVFQNGVDFEPDTQAQIPAYNTFLALNNTHNGCPGPSSWSPEMVGWGVTDSNPALCSSTLTASTVFFAIPVTAGITFDLGIWASVEAGEVSAGNPASNLPQDTGSADLAHTFLWGGPGYVIEGDGQAHTDFTISSLSGSDYNVAAADTASTPEPSTEALFVLGMAAIGVAARRRAATR